MREAVVGTAMPLLRVTDLYSIIISYIRLVLDVPSLYHYFTVFFYGFYGRKSCSSRTSFRLRPHLPSAMLTFLAVR